MQDLIQEGSTLIITESPHGVQINRPTTNKDHDPNSLAVWQSSASPVADHEPVKTGPCEWDEMMGIAQHNYRENPNEATLDRLKLCAEEVERISRILRQ